MANGLFEKYNVRPAVAAENIMYENWVYARAREVDISNPAELARVRDLSVIMELAMQKYGWAAVSSNNLWWNATNEPIRAIMVPYPDNHDYLTIVNPFIGSYNGVEFGSVERCGSFPGASYVAKIFPSVAVSGYLLTEEGLIQANFEYGSASATLGEILDGRNDDDLVNAIASAAYVQHEIDHTNGIVIPNKGVLYEEVKSKKEEAWRIAL